MKENQIIFAIVFAIVWLCCTAVAIVTNTPETMAAPAGITVVLGIVYVIMELD